MLRQLACAAALASTAGCASIIRGTSQDFTVQTDPAGAQAVLSTGERCEATPCTLRRSRNEPFTVTVSMEGYQTTTHAIRNPWSRQGTTTGIVGNAILGGGIGIGVDAMTGANRDLTPNPLVVALAPSGQTAGAAVAQTEVVQAEVVEPGPSVNTQPAAQAAQSN